MSKQSKTNTKKRGGVGTLLALPVALASGWIAYSRLGINHRASLPAAIPAERAVFLSRAAGWLSYYEDRSAPSGRPLALIHSVNAAASAYEMSPLFAAYRGRRPVFALDLPGYGFSNRMRRTYTPQLFADTIAEFLATQVGEPADVIALSLGCEFTARAAMERPELLRSLTLISPSGFNSLNTGRASQKAGMRGSANTLYSLLSFPLWSRALFDLITVRRSIEFFLRQSFVGPITPGFVDYSYLTSHQPGAENVPLHFLSGRLFTRNAANAIYANVPTPTLVIYDQDAFVNFDGLPSLLGQNEQWQAMRLAPSRGLPHFERLDEMTAALEQFWGEQD